jgi:aspartate oxidase
LGPTAADTLAALGVDFDALRPGRQRVAFECLDSTERAPHLAGALGDAVAAALVRRRWIGRKPDSRVITLTPSGARGLHAALGIELSAS